MATDVPAALSMAVSLSESPMAMVSAWHAKQGSHVAHGGAFVDAVDEQFAVIRRDLVV